jgi:O-antigen/teichoic acid export membrane protein
MWRHDQWCGGKRCKNKRQNIHVCISNRFTADCGMRENVSAMDSGSAHTKAHVRAPTRSGQLTHALRNAIWLGGDKLISIFAGLLVFGMVARTYGPEGSGHLAFAMAVLQTALGLSLVCSGAALLPRMCRQVHAIPGMLANVFVVRLLASLLAAALAAMVVFVVVDDPTRRSVALIVLASVPLIEPFYLISTYWQSRNANRVPVVSRSVGVLSRLAAVALAVWVGAPLWVVALAWILEACISATLQTVSMKELVLLRSLRVRVRRSRLQAYLGYGSRFVAGLWLSHLYLRLDRLVFSELMPAADYGIYAAAMQLVEVWLQVATLVGVAIGPAFLYSNLRRDNSLAAQWRVFLFMAGLGALGCFAVFLFGKPVLALVFGAPFAASYPFLVAGMLFGVLFFADQIVQLAVTAANDTKTLALRWAIACAVALATQFLLFNRIGAYAGVAGLSLGLVASWTVLPWLRHTKSAARKDT